MAIRQIGNNTIVGLSSEIPTTGASGTIFIAENTGNIYHYFSGTTPNLMTYFTSGSSGTESVRVKNSTTTNATGNYAVAVGGNNSASGISSFVSGSGCTASGNYSFIHGLNSIVTGTSSVVLGANITGTSSNTTYVEDFNIKKFASIPTSSADAVGTDGSITWDNNHFYWKANGQWLRVTGSTF